MLHGFGDSDRAAAPAPATCKACGLVLFAVCPDWVGPPSIAIVHEDKSYHEWCAPLDLLLSLKTRVETTALQENPEPKPRPKAGDIVSLFGAPKIRMCVESVSTKGSGLPDEIVAVRCVWICSMTGQVRRDSFFSHTVNLRVSK